MKKAMLPSLKIDSWTEEALSDLTAKISDNKVKSLILIDGAAGSGKTTLAVKLAERLHANLVHTDDVSWCADPILWDEELLDGIVKPWSAGKKVAYKQPAGKKRIVREPSRWIRTRRLS